MEKRLKCFLLLPLKEIALRRLGVHFWSDQDILNYVLGIPNSKIYCFVFKKLRAPAEKKIKDKIAKLVLPIFLKKQLTALIRPLGFQVLEWKITIESFLYCVPEGRELVAPKPCWTTAGTIDYRKTAQELVRCNQMDVEICYNVACCYCLEDYVSLYWKELPEEKKKKYGKFKRELPHCWPRILQAKQNELDYVWRIYDENLTSFNQFAFERSAKSRCKTAAEYFLPKLTPEERESSLQRSLRAVIEESRITVYPEEKVSHIMFFLLSAMTPKQQVEAIKAHPIELLFCFLEWPLQDLLSENADIFWTIIPPSSYILLVHKIFLGYKFSNFHFPLMFKVLFPKSPEDFKKQFVAEELPFAYCFLGKFFTTRDSVSIKAFFRTLDAADRIKIVFNQNILKFFYGHVMSKDDDLVMLCLREASLSKEEKDRLKEAFTRIPAYKRKFKRKSVRQKFKRIFEFLNDNDQLTTNQKPEIGNCSLL